MLQGDVQNKCLTALPNFEYETIQGDLQFVALTTGEVIYQPQQAITDVYFPESGLISLIGMTEDGSSVEVAMIGKEGALGLLSLLSPASYPYRATVQIQGKAFKVSAKSLRKLFTEKSFFQQIAMSCINCVVLQIAQSVICNRFHNLEQRLARWLLVSHDCIGSTHLPYTHDILASFLGTRRVSITLALGALQESGILRPHRGVVEIIDRDRLEKTSCECYAIVRSQHNAPCLTTAPGA